MSGMFKKILVSIDGSTNSYRGLQYATDIAKKYDADITLIHIVEEPIYAYSSIGPAIIPDKVFSEIKENAEKLFLKRKNELNAKGVQTKTLLKRGNPSVEILKASEGFDLIVMGSRGLGRFKTYLLGSVSNSVVQHSKAPVLIVRPK